jgi:GH18 family chitinase
MPKCGGAQKKRKIGYYAGWGDRRKPCPWSNVSPSQIDWTGYTHAHFAFATITQKLEIRQFFSILTLLQMSDSNAEISKKDSDLLKELVQVKKKHQDLNVIIAVGGWTFSYVCLLFVFFFFSF